MQVLHTLRRHMFGRYLLVTNTVTCGSLLALGDISVQLIERAIVPEKKKQPLDINWKRTGRFFAMGAIFGPMNHVWYTSLDKFFPGKSFSIIVKKIIADQVIASPIFTFTFFMGLGAMEGNKASDNFTEFKNKFLKVYMADWSFWPAAQTVNFCFIPGQYRVMYVCFATYVWDCFLCYAKMVWK